MKSLDDFDLNIQNIDGDNDSPDPGIEPQSLSQIIVKLNIGKCIIFLNIISY